MYYPLNDQIIFRKWIKCITESTYFTFYKKMFMVALLVFMTISDKTCFKFSRPIFCGVRTLISVVVFPGVYRVR